MGLNKWPAGYSLLVAVFYKFTGSLIASTVIIDIIFITTFILLLRKLMKMLGFPIHLINLLTLFQGFIIAPYIEGPTDLHAGAFLILAVILCVRFFSTPAIRPAYGIWIGIAAFASVFLRYMYLPTIFVYSGVLWLAGLIQKDRRLILGAIYSFSTAVILTASLLIFNSIYSGASSFVMPTETGFFPGNLARVYPFIFGAFLNIDFILTQLWIRTGTDYEVWYNLLTYLNIVVAVALSFAIIIRIKKRKDSPVTTWRFFSFLSLALLASIVAMLIYLSVTNGIRTDSVINAVNWTFINDGRYYVWSCIVLPVVAAYYLFVRKEKSWWKKPLRNLFLIVLVFEISHGLYFVLKPTHYSEIFENAIFPSDVYRVLSETKLLTEAEGKVMVVTGSSDNTPLWGNLHHVNSLFDSRILIRESLRASKPARLILVSEKVHSDFYNPFINRTHAKLIFDDEGFVIYQYELPTK